MQFQSRGKQLNAAVTLRDHHNINVHKKVVVIAGVINKKLEPEANMRTRRQNMDSAIKIVQERRVRMCR
jgi:hypothetical protein